MKKKLVNKEQYRNISKKNNNFTLKNEKKKKKCQKMKKKMLKNLFKNLKNGAHTGVAQMHYPFY